MSSFAFRDSLLQLAVVVVLVGAGSLGVMVLLDPRAQAFWGARSNELGTAIRLFADALPYPGKP